jgi:hypothetical protein
MGSEQDTRAVVSAASVHGPAVLANLMDEIVPGITTTTKDGAESSTPANSTDVSRDKDAERWFGEQRVRGAIIDAAALARSLMRAAAARGPGAAEVAVLITGRLVTALQALQRLACKFRISCCGHFVGPKCMDARVCREPWQPKLDALYLAHSVRLPLAKMVVAPFKIKGRLRVVRTGSEPFSSRVGSFQMLAYEGTFWLANCRPLEVQQYEPPRWRPEGRLRSAKRTL